VGMPRFVGKPPVNMPGAEVSPRPGAGPTKPR
jgi:hypothetical protein